MVKSDGPNLFSDAEKKEMEKWKNAGRGKRKNSEVDEFLNSESEEDQQAMGDAKIKVEPNQNIPDSLTISMDTATVSESNTPINAVPPTRKNIASFLKPKDPPIEKDTACYYIKVSTIKKIEKYAGTGEGKTGYSKSELVDKLLDKAFELLDLD